MKGMAVLLGSREAARHEECRPHVLCECPEPRKCAS
jgi:hypothetical protein